MKKNNKKVAIIGTVGLPANYGGFETLVAHLADNISTKHDLTVYCSGKTYPKKARKKYYKKARLKYLPFNANGISSILYDTLSILHALFYADVLLILGVAGAWILPFVKTFSNKKIIISIDGIEWKRDKWNLLAKWYLFWAEKIAVKYSHIDISDNEAIQDYTAARYGSLSRVIEYGADHTMEVQATNTDKKEFPFLNKPYVFKVCRIEPENNIHVILKAFVQIPQKTLVLVGNWNKSEYGRKLRYLYGDLGNLILLDPIYDQRKLDLLRGNASLYIHGHSAGGTNPSLVEAMYLGLPILAYDVSYNRVTTENQALYFQDERSLIQLIKKNPLSDLKQIGFKMQNIAQGRYYWDLIAEKYQYLIEEVLLTESKPSVYSPLLHLEESFLLQSGMYHLKNQDAFFIKR